MAFLSPLFLAGLAAAAIPIAIHLFYRRAEPLIEFAAMRYLRRAPVEESRHRRLRELILLALRVTALALLAWAFARPYFNQSAAAFSDSATIVLVDTSASLSAPGQFERARERAEQVVREAPAADAVGALSFARTADVIAPLSRDRAGALVAIAKLKVGFGATRFQAALQRAADELEGRSGQIVVVTDLQRSGWDAANDAGIPDGVTVSIEEVAGPESNLAVTSLRIEDREAVAVVQNFSPRPTTEQVVFTAEKRRIGAVPVVLTAGGSAEARLPLEGVGSGMLSAAIVDRNGYLADNTRYLVVDPADAISVVAVTPTGHPSEALYLERALGIAEGAGGFRLRTFSGEGFSALEDDVFNDVKVIVVLGTRGLEQRGRSRLGQFVRSGGGLLLAAGPDSDPAVVRQALDGVVSTSWRGRDEDPVRFAPDDSRHPIFRLFGGVGTLGNVAFAHTALIDVRGESSVIARYTDGSPAVVEERTSAGRVLILGSDLNDRWNDFALQPAFVPFVHETLRYLASPRSLRFEYLVGDLAGSQGATPGGVTLSGDRKAAVNIDPRESDPAPMTADTFMAGISRLTANAARRAQSEARQQEDSQGLWRYGLLLMVVSLAAEGLLGRRLG
jgi:hypothetical protein